MLSYKKFLTSIDNSFIYYEVSKQKKGEKMSEENKNDMLINRLLKTRSVIISGEINQKLVDTVAKQLFVLQDESDDPIRVFINSQGGHVESGDTIYDLFKFVRPKIIAIGTGWVASAAITIYLGAAKENRLSLPNTRYLIHQPMGGVQGTASDIKIEAEEIIKIRKRVNKIISNETGQNIKKVEKDTERNYWMSADEAIHYGLVSRIVQNEKEI